MRSKPRSISAAQLVMLLFVSRFFALMTYFPRAGQSVSGPGALFTQPISALLTFVVLLPFLWLCRKRGNDPLDCAFGVGRVYGIIVSLVFCLFCLQAAAFSASGFSYFFTSTVYQGAAPQLFIFLLLAAAAYGASMGLEAFSRMGTLVFILLAAGGVLLGVLLLPELKPVYLVSPLLDGASRLSSGVLRGVLENAEPVLFLLLLSRTKNGGGRTAAQWLLLSTAAFLLLTFLLLTTLGDYAQTRLFPLHTATSFARLSLFGRLDLAHIMIWIFVAFLRGTLYLYGAVVCLRRIFPPLRVGAAAAICGAIAASVSAVTFTGIYAPLRDKGMLLTGVPLLVLTVAFPLVTLLCPHKTAVSPASP